MNKIVLFASLLFNLSISSAGDTLKITVVNDGIGARVIQSQNSKCMNSVLGGRHIIQPGEAFTFKEEEDSGLFSCKWMTSWSMWFFGGIYPVNGCSVQFVDSTGGITDAYGELWLQDHVPYKESRKALGHSGQCTISDVKYDDLKLTFHIR